MPDIRREFVEKHASGLYTVTELAQQFGVSRQTAYKWLRRFREDGYAGLQDRRRRPHNSPTATPRHVVRRILELRDEHHWGARKIKEVLETRWPGRVWPSHGGIHGILVREGRVVHRRRRRRHGHPGKPIVDMSEPNAAWTADYKGEFRLGNGRYCYPLTVADGCSRFLLKCRSLRSTRYVEARETFEALFEERGIPEVILTDNGSPFASTGLCGLTRLSAWWIRLGIRPVRTEPASPQQNGRHERMHRTLNAAIPTPPCRTHAAQQKAFDRFLYVYNEERPHEALGMRRPAQVYEPSSRPFLSNLPPLDYPGEAEVRLVSRAGSIRWHGLQIYVSTAVCGDRIGLLQIDDGIWSVRYGHVELGRLDERTGQIA